MAPIKYRSRIHLFAAKEAPTIVILQRKRAKLFHVVTVNTEKHWVKEGSWFRGKLYGMKCDVSFDGKFMVYLATGTSGESWSGLCRLPWLKTLVDAESIGTSGGGGYFASQDVLTTNVWGQKKISPAAEIPFTLKDQPLNPHGRDERGAIYLKLERDGFERLGTNWGKEERIKEPSYRVICAGDDGYGKRPSIHHPQLKVRYLGYSEHGYRFAFSLDEHQELVEGASWATWNVNGNLWVARPGIVEQFTLKDMNRGTPSFSLDVDQFEPPPKPAEEDIDEPLSKKLD
jgi:hypothetical protein